MRTFQRLVRNGNSTQITLPKAMLTYVGWLPGDVVIVELQEDGTIRLRPADVVERPTRQAGPAVLPDAAAVRP